MIAYERINAVVSITLIGLALFFVLEFPAQTTLLTLFGTPIEVDAPRQWLMVILLGGLAMAGADAVIQMHPKLPTWRLSYRATFWMAPGLLVILATQTLGLAPTPIIWTISLGVVGVLLWLTIFAEYKQVGPAAKHTIWSRLWQQLIGYAVILTFYILIYQSRSRSALSATTIVLISSMMALALLRQNPAVISKSWVFAFIIGLSLGQITWALNYWRTGALNAGILLFVIFYVLVGLSQQHLWGSLSRKTLWEFGAIAGAALLVVYYV
jgi:hypothetical protein